MTTTAPLLAGGATLSFSCLEGTVIKTDQRSDSYTTGSGRVLVLEGTGGGNSQVSTEVVISRDIWLNDREGQEHHVRVNKDIPVREGQDVAFIYASGEKKRGKFPASKQSGLMSLYVLSTNTSYTVRSLNDLAVALARPYTTASMELGTLLAYGMSLFFCLVYGVGLLPLGYLAVRDFRRKRRWREETADVVKELEAEHQRLLKSFYSEHKKRLAAPQTSPQPQLQAREAT